MKLKHKLFKSIVMIIIGMTVLCGSISATNDYSGMTVTENDVSSNTNWFCMDKNTILRNGAIYTYSDTLNFEANIYSDYSTIMSHAPIAYIFAKSMSNEYNYDTVNHFTNQVLQNALWCLGGSGNLTPTLVDEAYAFASYLSNYEPPTINYTVADITESGNSIIVGPFNVSFTYEYRWLCNFWWVD